MSSTRRARDGEFHQERYCSSPEFEGDTINGLAAAKRIAIVKDPATRELLWWIQWLSLTPGALQALCDELVLTFPDRIGTPTIRKLQKRRSDRVLSDDELETLNRESGYQLFPGELAGFVVDDDEPVKLPRRLSEASDTVENEIASLKDRLVRFCLDPQQDIQTGVWFFDDLLDALTTLRSRRVSDSRARLADTVVTRKINETLDFWFARGRMVLIEGVAGIGRTATARAWCDAHPGTVRYVEIPSSSDDRSFFAAIARQLGIARGASFKAQQIKVRVEEMLATSDLRLVFDEAQYAWGGAIRPRKTPDRILWIKTTFDAGTPIALVAHTDFSKWQQHFVDRTLWTDEQFERRLNRRLNLPAEHSPEDMLKIARAHHPNGDPRSWKLLAAYALGTEKKQASGIVEALESARYRAELAGRGEPAFADIEAALIHDHGFLSDRPQRQPSREHAAPIAKRAHNRCKTPAGQPRQAAGESDFPIQVALNRVRITAPGVAA